MQGVTVKEKQEGDIAITYVDIDAEGEERLGKNRFLYHHLC